MGKILVACEESQTVCKTFRDFGYEAYSCDLKDPTGGFPEWHIKGDALEEAYSGKYDLMIAHPPCTFLAVSGNKWLYHPDDKHLPSDQRRPHPKFPNRRGDMEEAAKFFVDLYNAPVERVCIENPVSRISSFFRPADQYIQPYQFGEDAEKKTGLWLKNLPKLGSTNIIEPTYVTTKSGKRYSTWWWETCKYRGGERQTLRSKTFQGIADAIVTQWGPLVK